MSIGAVTGSIHTPPGGKFSAERQDMMALQNALATGDLAGAQQAFAQFKQDFHAAHNGQALYQTGVPDVLKQDLQGLQSALKSGDLAGAQQAFAQFKQDFQSLQRARREPPASTQNSSTTSANGVDVLA